MSVQIMLDIVLIGSVLVTAYRAIHAPEIFAGVIVYIVFGLLLALVWARLGAPDLAIAEAAIGAGITGTILLGAARQLGDGPERDNLPHWSAKLPSGMAATGFAAVLAATFLTLGERSGELPARVAADLRSSGVEHPVTAVLLNYRAYDTLLEVAVLLVAATAVLALAHGRGAEGSRIVGPAPAVARGAAALLAPLGVLVAAYLLWRGSHAPGGAFQAGAVLGAVGVLLAFTGNSPLDRIGPAALRGTLVAGLGAFLLAGLFGLVRGGLFLEVRGAGAGLMILMVETALTISIGATLALLVSGAEESADEVAEVGEVAGQPAPEV